MWMCGKAVRFYQRQKRLWSVVAMIAGLHVVSAQAQPTTRVEILMDEPCINGAPNNITVVLTAGGVTVQFPVERDRAPHAWTGSRTDGKTFSAGRAIASLRLRGTRTDCEQSIAAQDEKREDVAKFIFHCNQQTVRNLRIVTDGPVGVSYTRKSSACIEEHQNAYFHGGSIPYPLEDIWVPGEELRLKLGWDRPDSPDPGLLVFSLDTKGKDSPVFATDPKNSGLLVFDSAGKQHKQKVVDALPLDRKGIVNALAKQRGAINGDTSPNARNNDNARLERVRLNMLTVTVK